MKYTRKTVHSFRLHPTAHLLGTMRIARLLYLLPELHIPIKNLTVAISVAVNATGDNKGLAILSAFNRGIFSVDFPHTLTCLIKVFQRHVILDHAAGNGIT